MKFAKVKADIDPNYFFCSEFTVNGAQLKVRNFELGRDSRGDVELTLTIGKGGFDFNIKKRARSAALKQSRSEKRK